MVGTPLTLQTAKVAGTPNPLTGLTTSSVSFQPLAGFPAATPQDSTPYTSAWIQCAPGMTLELTLSVTSLLPGLAIGGTLDIEIQEISPAGLQPGSTEPVTLLTQQFNQPPSTPAPSAGTPFVSTIVAPTKGYIRIVATPGKAAGQSAAWVISGRGYTPGRSAVQGN